MYYIISDNEIKDLEKGKLRAKDIMRVENEILFYYSGADLKEILELIGSEIKVEDCIDRVKKLCQNLDCWQCIEIAVGLVVDDMKAEKRVVLE